MMISKAHLKQIKALHLKKNRDADKLFLVEGVKPVCELIMQHSTILKEVLATKDFILEHGGLMNNNSIHFIELSEEDLKQASTMSTPNKVIAVCNYFEGEKENSEGKVRLYLDDIRDPGNFGTIIRSADWFGMKEVYCSENSCDLYNPKVIQSTMGSFARVKVIYISLEELMKNSGIKKIFGAVLGGENIYKKKLESGIIVIGNEASGISHENLKLISDKITIPSASSGGSESLNAAMATSIILSEFYRTRYS
jgi:TrmH family RNA methyltransferase